MAKIIKRTVEFKAHSRNLFFHILTACNLKCKHCYINPKEHGTKTLELDTIKSWLKLFSIKKGAKTINSAKDTNVVFLGGEPTLNPALPDAIKYAKKLDYGSITVDTNGYLFNDILYKVSPDDIDYFSFSLDGSTPERNDIIRGEGSFKTCTAGIRRAKELGFNISVIFTCSSQNIDDLPNMPNLLKELGVNRFFIQVIGIRGKPAKEKGGNLQLSWRRWKEIVPFVAKEAAKIGIICNYPKVFLDLDERFECAGIVAENFFVFPNGRVYTCPLCEDYPLHAYEIIDNELFKRPPLTEEQLFSLKIPEGCVMNKIFHPGNIPYDENGNVLKKVACCMLKEELITTNLSL